MFDVTLTDNFQYHSVIMKISLSEIKGKMYKLLIIVYVVIEPMIDISELNTLLCSVVGV